MKLRFWGVRGGMPMAGSAYAGFGGNTSCVEVRCADHLLILDAGSGLHGLGQALRAESPIAADLLLSHTHLDHLCGLPFFAPLFRDDTRLTIWGGNLGGRDNLAAAVASLLTPPLMPDLLAQSSVRLDIRHVCPGVGFSPRPGVRVETAPLIHPGGGVGYRISADGVTLAYVADTEHPATGFDPNVVRLTQGADALIYDAYYDNPDYAAHVGWGHSTWQHAVALAEHVGARVLLLFHHNIFYDDDRLATIQEEAGRHRPGTIVARDGLCINL